MIRRTSKCFFRQGVWLLFEGRIVREKQKATDQCCVMVAGVTRNRQQKSHRLCTPVAAKSSKRIKFGFLAVNRCTHTTFDYALEDVVIYLSHLVGTSFKNFCICYGEQSTMPFFIGQAEFLRQMDERKIRPFSGMIAKSIVRKSLTGHKRPVRLAFIKAD